MYDNYFPSHFWNHRINKEETMEDNKKNLEKQENEEVLAAQEPEVIL